jgi:hypothetical protein
VRPKIDFFKTKRVSNGSIFILLPPDLSPDRSFMCTVGEFDAIKNQVEYVKYGNFMVQLRTHDRKITSRPGILKNMVKT